MEVLPVLLAHVHVLAVDEEDDVGVLLDGAALAQVAEHGDVGLAGLDGAGHLGEGQDGHLQLARQFLERAGDVAHLGDAVDVEATAGAAVHQLHVVDDDQVQADFMGQAAGLGAQLGDGDAGGFVDVDLGAGEGADGAADAPFLGLGVHAVGEALRGDLGFAGDEAGGDLLGGHLQTEEGHLAALADGEVAGDGERKGGFADGRASGQHDHIRTLEARKQGVQLHETGAGGLAQALLVLVLGRPRKLSSRSRRRTKSRRPSPPRRAMRRPSARARASGRLGPAS